MSSIPCARANRNAAPILLASASSVASSRLPPRGRRFDLLAYTHSQRFANPLAASVSAQLPAQFPERDVADQVANRSSFLAVLRHAAGVPGPKRSRMVRRHGVALALHHPQHLGKLALDYEQSLVRYPWVDLLLDPALIAVFSLLVLRPPALDHGSRTAWISPSPLAIPEPMQRAAQSGSAHCMVRGCAPTRSPCATWRSRPRWRCTRFIRARRSRPESPRPDRRRCRTRAGTGLASPPGRPHCAARLHAPGHRQGRGMPRLAVVWEP